MSVSVNFTQRRKSAKIKKTFALLRFCVKKFQTSVGLHCAHGSRLMASSRLQNQLAGGAAPVEGAMGGGGIGQGKRAADIDLELPTGDPA